VTLADLTTANFHDLLNGSLGAWPWIAQQLTSGRSQAMSSVANIRVLGLRAAC
jgi:hypothetical protein